MFGKLSPGNKKRAYVSIFPNVGKSFLELNNCAVLTSNHIGI